MLPTSVRIVCHKIGSFAPGQQLWGVVFSETVVATVEKQLHVMVMSQSANQGHCHALVLQNIDPLLKFEVCIQGDGLGDGLIIRQRRH